jgi:hypothetical protein
VNLSAGKKFLLNACSKPCSGQENKFMKPLKTGLLTLICLLGIIPSAIAQDTVGKITLHGIKKNGAATFTGAAPKGFNYSSAPRVQRHPDLIAARRGLTPKGFAAAASVAGASLGVPVPEPNKVKNGGNQVGFEGLTTVDTANTNGFVLSPPDQGLCVGNGFVMETINLVMTVYKKTGLELTTPMSLNTFFGADPNTTFLSDPRCYYDIPTQRWFVSVTNVIDFNNNRSNLYLAVSESSDPTGGYNIYSIDTTDDGQNGTPKNPGCNPCFGDQPLLGADSFGIYLSTNEFGVFNNTFNGAQIYALSKATLEAGGVPTVVHIGNLPLAESIAYSLQPASSPDLEDEMIWDQKDGTTGGVEYFLSALDFNGTLDNRIAVWALTNTSSLSQASPSVSLTNVVINSEVYGQPPQATQKVGPYPLGQSLGEPEETVASNDDRMQQAVFADDHLWGALNTVVSDGIGQNVGIAYFCVKPSMKHGKLSAKLEGQNYVSVKGASVMFPSVGVTGGSTAAIALTLTGPSYFPSAAFARVNPSHASSVNIVAAGGAPQDDFSGYPPFGTGTARWGDYSSAVADGGSLWLATEYIPGNIDSLTFFTNFGTFIYEVDLQ